MWGLSGGELATLIVAGFGAVGGLPAAYFKFKADLSRMAAENSKSLTAAETKFRDTLIEQEQRCRQDNHELRGELIETQARLLVVERNAMFAEVQLEVRGKLDLVLERLGVPQSSHERMTSHVQG